MKSQRRVLVFLVCFIVILAAAPAEAPAPPGKRPRAESRAKQKQQPKSRAKVKKKPAKPASSASWLKKFAARFRSAPRSRDGQAGGAAKPPPNTSLRGLNFQKICGGSYRGPSKIGTHDRYQTTLGNLNIRRGANQVAKQQLARRSSLDLPPKAQRPPSLHPEVQPFAKTFDRGKFATKRLEKDTVVYRYHDRPITVAGVTVRTNKAGKFYTKKRYEDQDSARRGLNLGTNPGQVTKCILQEGTRAHIGGVRGGSGTQTFIAEAQLKNVRFLDTRSLPSRPRSRTF